MLPIYLCEDNQIQLKHYSKIIHNHLLMEELDARLECAAADPYSLLDHLQHSEEYPAGLYFLDIDLGCDMNGIELASRIREFDPRGFLVFITTHSEMLTLTFRYRLEAMDFILKDEPDKLPESLTECIHTALSRLGSEHNQLQHSICLRIKSRDYLLDTNELAALTPSPIPHRTTLTLLHSSMKNGRSSYCREQLEAAFSLKELHQKLDKRFLQIHRTCIVNRDYISEVDYKEGWAILKDGSKYPLSSTWKRKGKLPDA